MTINEAAWYVSRKAKRKGFTVHLYESKTTDSVYIKLDFGVCGTIRISDHPSKEDLDFTYEHIITPDSTVEHLDSIVVQAIFHRSNKLKRYGKRKYNRYMKKNKVNKILGRKL